ncbi:WD40 repeat [Arabidopsis thaliana x Arabidopsis arenosa]|uniref:WD40 repeat n=2 Tax=Arabidopsis TaxID=3701 RepID=A0A8T2AIR1_ARASU|nr:WD40 repeat [Arabidopsis thaliana x Arabidopsis arenosa]KAG7573391.1 WD40 repeat [Arabidopsis suecica]
MAQSNWEADKMLDVYIYDYLVKKKLHNTAKSFMTEGKVSPDPVAIDAPGGFLFEWWSVFWDIFIARTNEKHSEAAAAYIEAQQGKAKEQQMQIQQLQMMRQAQMQRRDPNHPSLGGPMNAIGGSEGMIGQSNASALAAKMYEERMKQPNPMNPETSQPHLDARMALLKSATNHHGQIVQGNHQGGVSAALQQIQSRTQQPTEIKTEVNMGTSPRQLPVDPSTVYGQGILQSKPGMGGAGLNPGVSGLPLKGWPLTGIEQIRPGLGGPQVQKSFLQNQSQFQLSPQHHQQQILAQVQAQGNMTNSPMYGGDMDPRRFTGLPRGNLNPKDGQQNANDGSIGSPMQSSSSKHISMPPVQQSSSQQQDNLLSQQSQQNNRKRKGPSSSGPANSTGTGNTVGPSNSQPSTPSTHTPVDGVAIAGNMHHVNSMPKGPMMYGSDGIGGLASSANQLDDMERFGDVGALEDNVESFLSQDDGDGGSLFGTLKRNPSEHTETSKAFSFNEVSSIRKSASKVICCNFSSDGKLLASAGHDKKVFIWNMETLQVESTPEEHAHIITDVRFRPNSTQLATSSFDKTIKIWDASDPGYFLRTITGHSAPVMSLDFHPKKTELLCSCDSNNDIRFWDINASCVRAVKGASTQVRFQPRTGQLLAAASENTVSIFDIENNNKRVHIFKGHSSNVHSVCWSPNGELVASVSEDAVNLWSLSSGECVHELSNSGNKFHSCVFHPSYPDLLVIGGYQSIELWNTMENKCMTIAGHECVISALAQSPSTGMVASASHDKSVKIWK